MPHKFLNSKYFLLTMLLISMSYHYSPSLGMKQNHKLMGTPKQSAESLKPSGMLETTCQF